MALFLRIFRPLPLVPQFLNKCLKQLGQNVRNFSQTHACLQLPNSAGLKPAYNHISSMQNSRPTHNLGLLNRVICDGFSCGNWRMQQVRHYKGNYKPNARKRLVKHGMQKQLSTRRGKIVLWRRILKGRHCVGIFEEGRYVY